MPIASVATTTAVSPFAYSLEAIPEAGWTIEASTRDLHHSDMAEGNVMTEYETKFSAMGNPICKLVASR